MVVVHPRPSGSSHHVCCYRGPSEEAPAPLILAAGQRERNFCKRVHCGSQGSRSWTLRMQDRGMNIFNFNQIYWNLRRQYPFYSWSIWLLINPAYNFGQLQTTEANLEVPSDILSTRFCSHSELSGDLID